MIPLVTMVQPSSPSSTSTPSRRRWRRRGCPRILRRRSHGLLAVAAAADWPLLFAVSFQPWPACLAASYLLCHGIVTKRFSATCFLSSLLPPSQLLPPLSPLPRARSQVDAIPTKWRVMVQPFAPCVPAARTTRDALPRRRLRHTCLSPQTQHHRPPAPRPSLLRVSPVTCSRSSARSRACGSTARPSSAAMASSPSASLLAARCPCGWLER